MAGGRPTINDGMVIRIRHTYADLVTEGQKKPSAGMVHRLLEDRYGEEKAKYLHNQKIEYNPNPEPVKVPDRKTITRYMPGGEYDKKGVLPIDQLKTRQFRLTEFTNDPKVREVLPIEATRDMLDMWDVCTTEGWGVPRLDFAICYWTICQAYPSRFTDVAERFEKAYQYDGDSEYFAKKANEVAVSLAGCVYEAAIKERVMLAGQLLIAERLEASKNTVFVELGKQVDLWVTIELATYPWRSEQDWERWKKAIERHGVKAPLIPQSAFGFMEDIPFYGAMRNNYRVTEEMLDNLRRDTREKWKTVISKDIPVSGAALMPPNIFGVLYDAEKEGLYLGISTAGFNDPEILNKTRDSQRKSMAAKLASAEPKEGQ